MITFEKYFWWSSRKLRKGLSKLTKSSILSEHDVIYDNILWPWRI